MAEQKTNTKQLLSYVTKRTFNRIVLSGAIPAILITAAGLLFDDEDYIFLMLGYGIIMMGVFLIAAGLVTLAKRGSLKRVITSQEAHTTPFDNDTLKQLTREKNLFLGENWLVLVKNGGGVVPIAKTDILSADSVSRRKEGMEKLWVRIVKKNGVSETVLYKACEPDPLEVIQEWLGSQELVRQEQNTESFQTCPYCTGPNDINAVKCQWCDKPLEPSTAVFKNSFEEPVETVSPVMQETKTPTAKSTYLIIGVLTVILVLLLAVLYL
ncbi:MAG: hypothetical protein IJ225_00090 [Solobacterium sp.]|nr:hypothetical protein [Solobacterium sp.]